MAQADLSCGWISVQAALPSSFTPGGRVSASEEISDGNILWRQYVLVVDLYRYYVDLVWKVTI